MPTVSQLITVSGVAAACALIVTLVLHAVGLGEHAAIGADRLGRQFRDGGDERLPEGPGHSLIPATARSILEIVLAERPAGPARGSDLGVDLRPLAFGLCDIRLRPRPVHRFNAFTAFTIIAVKVDQPGVAIAIPAFHFVPAIHSRIASPTGAPLLPGLRLGRGS